MKITFAAAAVAGASKILAEKKGRKKGRRMFDALSGVPALRPTKAAREEAATHTLVHAPKTNVKKTVKVTRQHVSISPRHVHDHVPRVQLTRVE